MRVAFRFFMVHLCRYKMERASREVQRLRIRLPMPETQVQSLVWEDSPGGGHDNPLQCSCLENPMDRGAWRATDHGVAESGTTEATQRSHTGTQPRGGGWKLKESVGFSKHKGGSSKCHCSRLEARSWRRRPGTPAPRHPWINSS